ncbi:MAG TPA: DUF4215 domain-containing protein, partial [Polyangiaceae bacterium]
CTAVTAGYVATCGNSKVDFGETCDDGNLTDGDGCSSACVHESSYYSCYAVGSVCRGSWQQSCGDGKRDFGEGCDDGNVVAGDGCNATCVIEAANKCDTAGAACAATLVTPAVCGDGEVGPGEQCEDDDGATPVAGDGCSDTCQIEANYRCNVAGAACIKPAGERDNVMGDVENMWGATATLANELWGNASANEIVGGNQLDHLYGAAGDDTLESGSGANNDVLNGGAGDGDACFGKSTGTLAKTSCEL